MKLARIHVRCIVVLAASAVLTFPSCDDNPSGPNSIPAPTYSDDSAVVANILELNSLSSIPVDSISDSSGGRITTLNLSYRNVAAVPGDIGLLTALQHLYLHANELRDLPDSIALLTKLETFTVGRNRLCGLDSDMVAFLDSAVTVAGWASSQTCVQYADDTLIVRALLDTNGLDSVSVDEVSDSADGRIVELLLAHRELSVLIDSIGYLEQLERLDLLDNELVELPDALLLLGNLNEVDLEYNQLCSLSVVMTSWADSYAPDWESYQTCTTGVVVVVPPDTSFFEETMSAIDEDGNLWLTLTTNEDSLVVDSIGMSIDSASTPVRVTFRPVGVAAYSGAADTACVVRSHGVSYGDSGGSPVVSLPPSRVAYFLDFDIQVCVECSSEVEIPGIRNGDTLQGNLTFYYRRISADTTIAGQRQLSVDGLMNAVPLSTLHADRYWLHEFRWPSALPETVTFDSLGDSCDGYTDLHYHDPFDLSFTADTLTAPAGLKLLGTWPMADALLECDEMDSVAALIDTTEFAIAQAGYNSTAAMVAGGVYWVRTASGDMVLLFNAAAYPGGVERYQFLWAQYR